MTVETETQPIVGFDDLAQSMDEFIGSTSFDEPMPPDTPDPEPSVLAEGEWDDGEDVSKVVKAGLPFFG